MTTNALYSIAEEKGYQVYGVPLSELKSFAIEDGGCYIALSSDLSGQQEKECLAYELGHCEYAGFYNRYSPYDIREKAERRADKWAFCKLTP